MARSASSSALGSQGINWGYAGALLAGGVVAAPIAAWLVKHLAGPRARRRGRWPDRAHQHQDDPGVARAPGVVVALAAAVLFALWVTGIAWAVKQERLARAVAADDRPMEPATA